MRISQILCGAGPVDAVTNQAIACRRLFRDWGWEGSDHSAMIAPGMPRGVIAPLADLCPQEGEVLLVHYSGYAPAIEPFLSDGHPTLLISHNVTPARWFWELEPAAGVDCSLAPGQLAELASRADAVAGVSEFNAAELRVTTGRDDVAVIPVLFDRSRLPGVDTRTSRAPEILFVGRLAPHKRQDLVIRAVGELARHVPDVHLRLVGVPISPAYGAGLHELAERAAPGRVTFESGISEHELWQRYLAAELFLCLSEHEGFCIPLIEAFHFQLPVIARGAGAVGEVVGDAGLLLDADDDLATVVELLRLVLDDGALRNELVARGERRLAAYEWGRTAASLRGALEALVR